MNSPLFPNGFILEQYSQIDISSESFDLFDYFRAINDAETTADLEAVCGNLSTYFKEDMVGDVNGMLYPQPLSSTSMSGTSTSVHSFPEIQPDLQSINYANLYPVASQYVEPVLYTAPQDYLVSTMMTYHESSYIGYPDPPLYSTTWESDVNSCPNSQHILIIDRMTMEAIDTNASNHLAIQTCQELGNPLPASDYCYQYTPFSEETQSTPYTLLGPAVTIPSYPLPDKIFNCSPADVCFCSPTTIPDLSPVSISSSPSSSSFLPAISQSHDIPVPPSRPSLSPTASAPAPRSTKRPQSPSTTRPSASKKAAHILPPLDKTVAGPAAKKKRRRSPDNRAAVQCEPWLEEYFPVGGRCTLCNGDDGPIRKRDDRALEHLASTHLIQIIKNIETYDENELADYSPRHLIQTAEQFEWTRRYIQKLRCALCVKETSLVYRGKNMETHLSQVHGSLPERIRLKELRRLYAFEPDRRVWYNFYDKFLYEFFSL